MKRFTETTKWGDPWFQDLPPEYKLFWSYLCDNCDCSGVWKVNFRLANFQIGYDISNEKVRELFGKRIHVIDDEKWFVIEFIKFQYGELSEDCRPHRPVLEAVKKHGLERVLKGYRYPTDKVQDKDKEKEEGECEGKKARPSSLQEVQVFVCSELKMPTSDSDWFWNKGEGNGWTNGGKKIKDWKATCRSWKAAEYFPSQKSGHSNGNGNGHPQAPVAASWRSEAEKVVRAAQDLQDAFLPGSVHPHLNRLKPQLVSGEFQTFARSKLKDEDYLRIEPLLGKYL